MPLNPLSYREVKRKLEAAGFVEVSQKGSHVVTVQGVRLRRTTPRGVAKVLEKKRGRQK